MFDWWKKEKHSQGGDVPKKQLAVGDLERDKWYRIDGDEVSVKGLGQGEFQVECKGNIMRFNMHGLLMEEYVKRVMKPMLAAANPFHFKTDKELNKLLKEKELEEDWDECAIIKKEIDARKKFREEAAEED